MTYNRGLYLRTRVTNFIQSPQHRSTATISHITHTRGAYGGYAADTETTTSSTTAYCLNAANMRYIKNMQPPSTTLRGGDVRLAMTYAQTLDLDDKVTWQGDEYEIEDIKEVEHGGYIVCKIVTLARDIDDS